MPDEQANNEQGSAEALPSLEYILEHWISIKEASSIMFMKEASIRRLCIDGDIRSKKIGRQWHIDPYAAHAHRKGRHRNKSD